MNKLNKYFMVSSLFLLLSISAQSQNKEIETCPCIKSYSNQEIHELMQQIIQGDCSKLELLISDKNIPVDSILLFMGIVMEKQVCTDAYYYMYYFSLRKINNQQIEIDKNYYDTITGYLREGAALKNESCLYRLSVLYFSGNRFIARDLEQARCFFDSFSCVSKANNHSMLTWSEFVQQEKRRMESSINNPL